MIYILELEPLKERYTDWWESHIPQEIEKLGKPCEVISGETLTDSVETGTVLDASSTNYWKASQLQKICEKFHKGEIKPHSHFLVADIWFPGIEMIRYMSQMYQIPVFVWGIWHAGSCTLNDFAEPMHNWSRFFEMGFLNMCDGIFVGSDYSKESIRSRLLYPLPKKESDQIMNVIHAYGMPLNYDEIQQYESEKQNIILFPHRPDEEKNPNIFIDIIQGLSTHWDDFEDYKFVFCTSRKEYKSQSTWINALLSSLKIKFSNVEILGDLSKESYYKLLGSSKLAISTTSEENFGYCAVEALALGTQVLLPNAFSHPEIVEENYSILYNTYDELLERIPKILEKPLNTKELKSYVEPYKHVVKKWVDIMGV